MFEIIQIINRKDKQYRKTEKHTEKLQISDQNSHLSRVSLIWL